MFAVGERCRREGINPPAANTVRARVRRVRADKAARAREGAGSAAARRLTSAAGRTPPAERPMAVLQIDHTQVDLILVDETWRKPVGRPWLSMAIDVHSRCIAGLHLSYEAPSATVAGLCLAHAALDKASYLRGLDIEADWPCQGLPGEVFVDNGSEFHSAAFERGCQQHGIALRFRPPGAPHWGGIVERLVGTVMAMVHELPGTTFSNPGERGDYDSDAASCLTLAELERWLVLAVTGPYHHAVHGGVNEPPLARWRRCCRDRPGGARALSGVAGSSLPYPGCYLAIQAERRPPPPHPQAEVQGNKLAQLRRQPAPARKLDGLSHR